ncbi:putative phage protein (predicted DNA packaging) [Arcanobacterium pluranimalium]|uniref:head-tail connector protein n=1 Tax=Arcanobacterium pluranimalium TaxID=108028 RepID=UPI00195B954E|nr:head-tail connector protein [Arcanobacterium pluranimalium]MBM7825133.1 putative phage protein (predicted DNA packaging) [Arcanobacterium pluranimalium]
MNHWLIDQVKANLILDHDADDELIANLVDAATSYACSFQHLRGDYYETHEMPGSTRQAIVMLASHFYESRDGSTAGFWSDKPDAAKAMWAAVNTLLRLEREWKV